MNVRWKRLAIASVAALASCLATATAQVVELGRFDGWLVVEDSGDACVMVNPAEYETAAARLHLRFEPGEAAELVASTIIPVEVPDPDVVDWGRLIPVEARYAFETGTGTAELAATTAEVSIGHQYIDAHRVWLDLYFDADEAMLDALEPARRFHVEMDGQTGYFDLGKPARALAEARKCLARLGG